MQRITGIAAVAKSYDAFILDLWGVIHDGTQLYAGVKDALEMLRAHNKKILFLSNAPRRASKVEAVLNRLGIGSPLYDGVISSGEAGYLWLREANAPLGIHYFYIGPEKDTDVLDGLPYLRVERLEKADFILNVGFGSDEPVDNEHDADLGQALSLGLPMLCLNPDLEVVKISGERFPCAGVLARSYEAQGGRVVWFGKPYSAVYEACAAVLSGVPSGRILAVGDSLETDIPGAKAYGLDSLLVTGGILKNKTHEDICNMCAVLSLEPRFMIAHFSW